ATKRTFAGTPAHTKRRSAAATASFKIHDRKEIVPRPSAFLCDSRRRRHSTRLAQELACLPVLDPCRFEVRAGGVRASTETSSDVTAVGIVSTCSVRVGNANSTLISFAKFM